MATTKNRLDIEINKDVTGIITAVQDDAFSRYLDVNLFDNGVAINLTEHKVRLFINKPDGKEIFNIGQITDAENGRVQFELTSQALAVCGQLDCQIIIFDSTEKQLLSTNIFKIFVTKSLKSDNAIESSNEYGALVVLFQDIYEARTQILEILEKIGVVGDKGEEIQKDTLFEQLEYLIDFSEKNSVGSLGEKIEEIKQELKRFEEKEKLKNWLSSPNTIIKSTQLNNVGDKIIIEVTGSGYLGMCLFNNLIHGNSGTQSYKVEIDDKVIFDTKVNFNNSWESGDGASRKISQIGIFNPNFYTYIENDDALGISIPVLSYGTPFLITSNLDRIRPIGSTKNTVSNSNGLIKFKIQYHAFYVPISVKIENLLRFEKKLKISTYDSQGINYTNQGVINCLYAYQLDD